MALTDENGGGIPATMLVGPTGYGGGMPYPVYQGGNGGGFGNGFGSDGWWVILLFLLLIGNNGWGNNGGGCGNGQPIIVNDGNGGNVQRGFDQAAVMGGLNGIQGGLSDIQMALCNGFAGVEQGANTRQMANMQQAFAAQTAMAQGFNQLGTQFADCCCENRLASADLKYTIATENCADRAALSDGVRDIIANQNASTQRILDQMCADKIDAKNEKIAELQNQLNMANLQASQIAQTAQIRAGQVAEIDAMYNRMRDCPVPTMPVYGMTPIFNCPNNNGCGCNG